jgi:hypothetical protein
MTIGTDAAVTVARHNILAGLPEMAQFPKFVLHTASGDTLLLLKETLVTLILGWPPMTTWLFFADIAHEFVLGHGVLRAQNASMDLKRLALRMGREVLPLQHPDARP